LVSNEGSGVGNNKLSLLKVNKSDRVTLSVCTGLQNTSLKGCTSGAELTDDGAVDEQSQLLEAEAGERHLRDGCT